MGRTLLTNGLLRLDQNHDDRRPKATSRSGGPILRQGGTEHIPTAGRERLQTLEKGDHPTHDVERGAELWLGQVSEALFPQSLPADSLTVHDGTSFVGE